MVQNATPVHQILPAPIWQHVAIQIDHNSRSPRFCVRAWTQDATMEGFQGTICTLGGIVDALASWQGSQYHACTGLTCFLGLQNSFQ